jgi:serine/threonine protein kinase
MPEVYPEDAIKPYPGKAADVWALGVITYMFVAASAPFTDGGNVNIDTIYHEKLVKNCQYVQQPSIASLRKFLSIIFTLLSSEIIIPYLLIIMIRFLAFYSKNIPTRFEEQGNTIRIGKSSIPQHVKA